MIRKLLKRLNPLTWIRNRKSVEDNLSYRDRAAILLSPQYEPVTRHMRTWLEAIEIPSGFSNVLTIAGSSVNRQAVRKALVDTKGLTRIKVFCGHGVNDALLGPPQNGEAIIMVGDTEHSAIYDAELVDSDPGALFAFCCSAGQELGKKFTSFRNHTFLGYKDELPIETENDECVDALKRIFRTIAAEIIECGLVLPEHEQRLKNLYHEAYLYFFQGEGRRNKRARYMWLVLTEHRRLICRYGGKP